MYTKVKLIFDQVIYKDYNIYFFIIQVKSLRQEKNIRFTRFQDNKTILHLGAERNAARVLTFSFVCYLGANILL